MAESECHASSIFLQTLQTEILSTGSSNLHKQMVFLRSFNSMLLSELTNLSAEIQVNLIP